MKTKIFLTLLILIGITGVSCDGLTKISSKQEQQEKSAPPKEIVESPQLAQLILKPNRPKLDISKDPFKPLFVEKNGSGKNRAGGDSLDDVKFLGLVRVGDTASALLQTKSGKKMYNLDDSLRGYKVMGISEAEVVLKNDKRTIKVKRGTEK